MAKKKAAAKKAAGKGTKREVDLWETIVASALPPGYVNVYLGPDNKEFFAPCPALLTRRLVATEVWLDIPNKPSRRLSLTLHKASKIDIVYGQNDDEQKEVVAAWHNPTYVGTLYDLARYTATVNRDAESMVKWLEVEKANRAEPPTPTEPASA